ncbi:MAG TPA: GNAT family N-acetyltransferase [Thermomicrobiales bacterium]|jgi:ribosomal protein S18 acetylase RimI-like enzyme|nr:GNAT family N-acetyltransferase [Thermomicrobiales bacterium]
MTESPAARGTIEPLRPADVARLRLAAGGAIDPTDARALLSEYPDRSVWVPSTLEFALLVPWRHRPEIAHVQTLSAVGNAEALLRAAAARSRFQGDDLLLLIDVNESRRPSFYGRAGLNPLEDVITYEFDPTRRHEAPAGRLRFRFADAADAADLTVLGRIDRDAFPWLWRNSDDEFRVYGATPGVELLLGFDGDVPVSYAGLTRYPGWGHLDRIAVRRDRQGLGFGRETLAFAVERMARTGARRIGLSTQFDNGRSQRLYERFGFRRSPGSDYRLYGVDFRPEEAKAMAAGEAEAADRPQLVSGGREVAED